MSLNNNNSNWKIQDYASLGVVLFGGVVFYYQYRRPSPPKVADIPLFVALNQVVQRDNIEFFFENDEKKERGLVNHEPLTVVALAKLWNNNQTIPEDILNTFHDDYSDFLVDFNASLVPPRPSFSSPPSFLSGFSDEDFKVWICSKRGGGTEAMDQLTPAIVSRLSSHGMGETISLILRQVGDENGILASLFHGFLLVCFSFDLSPSSPTPSSSSSFPSAPLVLVASGLSAMTARGPLKGNNLWSHLQIIPDIDDKRTLQERIDNLVEEEEGEKLWEVIKPLLKAPIFPFGLVGAVGVIEENEEALKIWKSISEKHLNGAKIDPPFEELAEVALRYFVKTGGCFLALHIVSAVFALCKIHTVSSGSEKSHKIDEDVIFGVARGLWNVVGMVVWLGEKGGEKEGVTVWDRARGKNKPSLEEVTPPPSDDPSLEWDIINQRAIMTLRSHTIKMVFACNSLSELFPNNQELGRLARVAAYYACLHAIG